MKESLPSEFRPRIFIKPRPDFLNPPVAEVALSVQFKRLDDFTTPFIGLLWAEKYRDKYPKTEELNPLEPIFEIIPGHNLPKLSISVEIKDKPPTHRCWFLNVGGTELVQVQQDRFAYNWRKEESDKEYPRYESVFKNFQREYEKFVDFISGSQLGDVIPNQCDITYVNPLMLNENINIHQHLERLITLFSKEYSEAEDDDLLLGEPENVQMAINYLMTDANGAPFGRLHVTIDPVTHSVDQRKAYLLKLTARGFPLGKGEQGIYNFMDAGREWIVRSFRLLTTKVMHQIWGIK
jgi:uncharacterized protein (TIGR04255 family)